MKTNVALAVLMLMAGQAIAQTQWSLDKAHSKIQFNVAHLVISEVTGDFQTFEGKVQTMKDDFNGGEIEFSADISSIDTDNEQRDNHLKGEDFFDAQKYPKLAFKGKLAKNGSKYQLKGDLTMKGVTKPVTFDVKYNGTVKDPWGNIKAGFKITGEVNRTDYGLTWNALTEAGGMVVGEEVDIICNIELQKQS